MRDAAGGDGVGERAHHRFLPDQLGKIARPVFAREHAIGGARLSHGESLGKTTAHRRGHPGRSPGGALASPSTAQRLSVHEVGDRTTTQIETRYGCFLPDLTGLARDLSAADLPPHYIRSDPRRGKADRLESGSHLSAKELHTEGDPGFTNRGNPQNVS